MTDNEIIKALECCCNAIKCDKNCPLKYKSSITDCNKEFLGLIKRQQAEIEQLQEEIRKDREAVYCLLKKVEAKAVKEFAERLKALFPSDNEPYQYWEIHEGADNLVKEMVGDEE